MPDEPITARTTITITAEVDLYEYDELDRGEVTDEKLEVWKQMCSADIHDALEGVVDTISAVVFSTVIP